MKKQILLFVAMLLPFLASAFDLVDEKGLFYNIKGDGTLEVVGLDAEVTEADILSDVTIGGVEYRVTSIGERAFEGRSDLTYLSIPWSVTSIGEYAFVDCGSSITVNIADPESWCQMELGNEHSSPLSSAGKVLVFDIETTSINIPEGVTSIGKFTFYQCRCITSLNIPASVKSIGSSTFEGCIGLTSLTLSEGLETIGGSAFEGCTGLKNLRIPNTVNTISINAFAKCTSITDVYCYAVNVPETDENAFNGTPTENSTLHVPANAIEAYKVAWPWSDFKEIVALNGEVPSVKRTIHVATAGTLSSYIRSEKYQIEELTLTGEINGTDLGFLREMAGQSTYTEFRNGSYKYGGPTNGKMSILDISSTNIVAGGVFHRLIQYKKGSDKIDDEYYSVLKEDNSLPSVFSSCKLRSLILPSNLESFDLGNLSGTDLTSITIPKSVHSISGSVGGNNNLSSITVDEGNMSYDSRYNCNAIIDKNNQLIVGCKNTIIPNSVTSIGSYAFSGCSGLTSVAIPNSVTSIGKNTFSNCNNLKDVYCYAEDVPNTNGYAFSGTPTESAILHVPANAVEAYKAVKPWSDFKEIVPLDDNPSPANGIIFTVKDNGTLEVTGLEDGINRVDILSTVTIDGKEYQVTSIGKRAFEGRDNIEYLSIPWSVTSIGEFAFIDCGNNMTVNIADPEAWCKMEIGNEHSSPLSHAKKVLVYDIETDQIDIPEGVTSIGKYTFYQCQCITSLKIPATVTSIGSSAFEGCTGLSSLALSDGLESIGGSAFEGCTGLKNLVIPSTVNTITINAFRNCKGITDVYCYAENVPTTDENAFDGTLTEKSTLHVPSNALEAYKASWPWSDFKEIVALTGDDPSGIIAVKPSDDGETPYYDLYGRRTYQPQQKGLYIRNGKKIMVK